MKKQPLKSNEIKPISQFIRDIGDKKYAEAKKSLGVAIENKLFNQISAHKNINIFRNE